MTESKALEGIKVIDAANLFAGPLAATVLGDFGAEVLKVEHPRGDPARTHGYAKDGVGLWWKMLGRNKRCVTLNLSKPEGQEIFKRLAGEADVVIESFRPGTFERWNLGWEELARENPGLVFARVTGFGQTGPYKNRPGFGTLAESMSGFAHVTGQPDGPPTLPPFGLADGIAALATAFAVLTALRARDATGRGQVVDLAIFEPIFTVLGPQPIVYDQLGVVQERSGNRSVNNAPRNAYETKDGHWVAISTSAQNIAERVMRLVGRPEYIEEPWFQKGSERAKHADELDEAVGTWISARTRDEVVEAFDEAGAAVAPIYSIADIVDDPQYKALETITSVDDPELGPIKMQNVLFRLSETPGGIQWSGPKLGQHNEEVYGGTRDRRAASAGARGGRRRMRAQKAPLRSYLYVPASDPRRVEKALGSEADAVVLDLEDAVAASRKMEARQNAGSLLETAPPKPVIVRVNAPGTSLCAEDLQAVATPHLFGIRLPKVGDPEEVRRVAEVLDGSDSEAGIQCLIESALGLEMAFEIARSHERVLGVSLGEADLAADLGIGDETGLLYARSRVVTASRAAGLPGPVQSVYTDVRDLDGLRRSTREGKSLGFVGRSAIHPAQLAIINEVFTPTEETVAEARDLLARLERSAGEGTGAFVLEDGRFVDKAVVETARSTLALAGRLEQEEAS